MSGRHPAGAARRPPQPRHARRARSVVVNPQTRTGPAEVKLPLDLSGQVLEHLVDRAEDDPADLVLAAMEGNAELDAAMSGHTERLHSALQPG
jgi:hypothetical protein